MVATLVLGACQQSSSEFEADAAAIAENNRGVALMGRFDYESAEAVFAELAGANPAWTDARINLAIATLNRQREGDEVKALDMVQAVLAGEPDNLRARYIAALLLLNSGETVTASDYFRQVAEQDPDDAYAAYYYAQALMQDGRAEEAVDWYRRSVEVDPYLRSGYYGVFMAHQRQGQKDEAKEALDAYQRLADNPRATLAEIKYTRMGPKANALAVNLAAPEPVSIPPGKLFESPATVATLALDAVTAISVVAENESTPNLLVTGGSGSALLSADGGMKNAPFVQEDQVRASAWGDFDNDGLVDLYLARNGANQLWRQTAIGEWEEIGSSVGVAGSADTIDAFFVDADHDGDLDILVVNADAPLELYNNNLDGSFRTLAAEQGLDGGGRFAHGIAAADLDGDRDTDLIVLYADGPNQVLINDRLWAYHAGEGFDEFNSADLIAVGVMDLDSDGRGELYGISPDGAVVQWARDAAGTWVGDLLFRKEGAAHMLFADVNGDGVDNILLRHAGGWSAMDAHSGAELFESDVSLAGWALLSGHRDGPALAGINDAGELLVWGPGPGRHDFIALTFSGREDKGDSMRSNASGIGTRIAVRVGSRWTVTSTFRHGSGPGQSLQPVFVGLGGAPAADYIAIDWSDGVFQTELDLAGGKVHAITETQRQLASCPVLFAWDGQGYQFVSDLLGVGGIGFNVGRGQYSTPRPWENFQLPAGLLKPRDGYYQLKITEPMEEVVYLDAVRLVAYDSPGEWKMVLDERLGTGAPYPTGETRWYRQEMVPVSARNERDNDVTLTIVERDQIAAPVGPKDARFLGLLAGEHVLSLEFDRPLDDGPGAPILIMDGWVEYGYSQTSFAAWQAGRRYEPPTLEYRDGSGRWRVLHASFGYPAGMPRRASVPLVGLPPGVRALRLRTTQEIYWDRLAVAWTETATKVRRHELPLTDSRVSKTGFPARRKLAQQRPEYDYGERSPFWDTRYPEGFYTALGPATELLAEIDSAVVIIGPGEEVHLEFPAELPPLPAGWSRRWVLETNGWAKDMDLYTRDGDTVAPLPVLDHEGTGRAALHARYNSRFQAGR